MVAASRARTRTSTLHILPGAATPRQQPHTPQHLAGLNESRIVLTVRVTKPVHPKAPKLSQPAQKVITLAMSDASKTGTSSTADQPIKSSSEDVLGRARSAHAFADSIRELDTSQGLVVGILGQWGQGKSSFINLMRERFEADPRLTVIDFNPWMFSGSDQLLSIFFREIGAELSVSSSNILGQVANWLSKYSEILRPVSHFVPVPYAGSIADIASAGISGTAGITSGKRSAQDVRRRIVEELEKLESPIVVVIDDIDRLATIEIREMFKLVRLTANFPNVVYILAFDRERVENALTEDGMPGCKYLEKIVQLSFDVPQTPKGPFRSQVFAGLNRMLEPLADARYDRERWRDVYSKVIEPLFSNMRDIARFTLSAKTTLAELGAEIDLVDLLAMEAVRVLRPKLFQRLIGIRERLARTVKVVGGENAQANDFVSALIAEFPDDEHVVRSLMSHVFPATRPSVNAGYHDSFSQNSVWTTGHRMADRDFFSYYLDRVVTDGLRAFLDAGLPFQLLVDADSLYEFLSRLPYDRINSVIGNLSSYEAEFTPDMIVPGVTALLNFAGLVLCDWAQKGSDVDRPHVAIAGAVYRLLRSAAQEAREGLVRKILPQVKTYSSQLLLIDKVAGAGSARNALVDETCAERLYADFAARFRLHPPEYPECEWDAGRIYDAVWNGECYRPLESNDNP